jgi:hypothetical protein
MSKKFNFRMYACQNGVPWWMKTDKFTRFAFIMNNEK